MEGSCEYVEASESEASAALDATPIKRTPARSLHHHVGQGVTGVHQSSRWRGSAGSTFKDGSEPPAAAHPHENTTQGEACAALGGLPIGDSLSPGVDSH